MVPDHLFSPPTLAVIDLPQPKLHPSPLKTEYPPPFHRTFLKCCTPIYSCLLTRCSQGCSFSNHSPIPFFDNSLLLNLCSVLSACHIHWKTITRSSPTCLVFVMLCGLVTHTFIHAVVCFRQVQHYPRYLRSSLYLYAPLLNC